MTNENEPAAADAFGPPIVRVETLCDLTTGNTIEHAVPVSGQMPEHFQPYTSTIRAQVGVEHTPSGPRAITGTRKVAIHATTAKGAFELLPGIIEHAAQGMREEFAEQATKKRIVVPGQNGSLPQSDRMRFPVAPRADGGP